MSYQAQRTRETTGFQTPQYTPEIDLRTDAVFVYGWSAELPARVALWRAQGYRVHLMTGAAWGHYDEYLGGDFDGRTHYDEAQVARNGERIDHGNAIFYIVPTESYTTYLKALAERAIDAGVDALHLEEPEFWVRGGYSESFKALWQAHYNRPWQAPHSSPAAWYQAAKLKYQLYTDCLDQVFQHAKAYADAQGRSVGCYVDSHSLINYSQWGIVSPASNLAHIAACDGYVCQVWTGTARTPNHLAGACAERTFETAYLEYGQMAAMVFATGRKIWFLADPIEDDPRHDWADYRRNYHATLVASLLYPEVSSYEVMPWPSRVFQGRYPQGVPAEQQSTIAPSYASELLQIANALTDMQHDQITLQAGPSGIGVCVSDTLVFERGWSEPEQTVLRQPGESAPPDLIYRLRAGGDPEFDGFFGPTLPLLTRGIPIRQAHLEHAALPGYLAAFDVLVLSYDVMKPPQMAAHTALAAWVRGGGVLLYWGSATPGPFDTIPAWWNQGRNQYTQPFEHLAEFLQISRVPDIQRVGDGAVLWVAASVTELAQSGALADQYCETVRAAYAASRARAGAWRSADALVLRRGPYVVAAALDRPAGTPATVIAGTFIDLFDGALPVRQQLTLAPGQHALLYDIGYSRPERCAIAATGRVEREVWANAEGRVTVSAPRGVAGQLVLQLAARPQDIRIVAGTTTDTAPHASGSAAAWEWDALHQLARVRYDGTPAGIEFVITFTDHSSDDDQGQQIKRE